MNIYILGACRHLINPREQLLLESALIRSKKFDDQDTVVVSEITRNSDHEFDFSYSAESSSYNLSAWMPLAAIGAMVNWTAPEVADMCDYPEMARQGDWSGVRDTEKVKLWAIFDTHVLPQL